MNAVQCKEFNRLWWAIDEHVGRYPELLGKCGLLLSIPGVGRQVSSLRITSPVSHAFDCPKQLAAYVGLVSVALESPTSMRAPADVQNQPGYLRKLFYLPAAALMRRLARSAQPNKANQFKA